MAEKKIICGGFLVGDGLDIDGKTLYATGGGEEGGKVRYVNFYGDETFQNITCELTAAQVEELIHDGNKVIARYYIGTQEEHYTNEFNDLPFCTITGSQIVFSLNYAMPLFSSHYLISYVITMDTSNEQIVGDTYMGALPNP